MDDDPSLLREPLPDTNLSKESEPRSRIANLRLGQCKAQLVSRTLSSSQLEPIAEAELKHQADILARFHYRYDLAFIVQAISACILSLRVASMIARAIFDFLQSRDARMVAFRISVERLFMNEDVECPILEWKESDGTEIISLFHFDDAFEPEECSWVMHLGVGRNDRNPNGPFWQSSRVDFNVSQLSHLKILFGLAQHILGVLQWPSADARRLYGDSVSSQDSEEEMTRYAKLLFRHLLELKALEAAFDRLAPVLQQLGQTEDRSPLDDHRNWRLRMMSLLTDFITTLYARRSFSFQGTIATYIYLGPN